MESDQTLPTLSGVTASPQAEHRPAEFLNLSRQQARESSNIWTYICDFIAHLMGQGRSFEDSKVHILSRDEESGRISVRLEKRSLNLSWRPQAFPSPPKTDSQDEVNPTPPEAPLLKRILLQVLSDGVRRSPVPGWGCRRGYYSAGKAGYPDPGGAARARVVDLRSDTVTKPGLEMRQAMMEAEVGDDVMGEDPTVNELQKMAAEMFGMEAALFVPSGTMSNLIAVMVHCRERGDEMIVGDLSHMHIYEQGGSANLAGVHATTVNNLPDGTFDLDQLESKIRHGYPDPHYPRSRLVCVENTHNIQGGRVLPLTFLREVRALAERYHLSVHMDGARLMNAAVALGVSPTTILQHTNTVSVCLSKGLGAPVGTMLAGPRDFISGALRCRKALGGGMRQSGILAAAGKLSLLKMVGRLEDDHRNAKTFAQALLDCAPSLFAVDMAAVQTNILRFFLQDPGLSPAEFCARMAQVGEGEEAALGQGTSVLMFPHFGNSVRAVWHLGISPEDTQMAIKKMKLVASQFVEEKLSNAQ